eukprot:161039_1
MGGGNGCKSKMKQQRNAAKNNNKNKGMSTKSKEHQKLANANICNACRQSFPNTAKEATLKAHVEAKHSSKKNAKSFQECFPTFGQGYDAPKDNNKNKKNKKKKNKK